MEVLGRRNSRSLLKPEDTACSLRPRSDARCWPKPQFPRVESELCISCNRNLHFLHFLILYSSLRFAFIFILLFCLSFFSLQPLLFLLFRLFLPNFFLFYSSSSSSFPFHSLPPLSLPNYAWQLAQPARGQQISAALSSTAPSYQPVQQTSISPTRHKKPSPFWHTHPRRFRQCSRRLVFAL